MKAYRFRIYPNVEQQELITKHLGCVRHVYNWALAEKKKHYEQAQNNLSRSELQKLVVKAKKDDKPWLREVNSQSLLCSLLNLDGAYQKFFRGQSRFPRFKSKYDSEQSFQCPQHVTVNFESGHVFLPKFKKGLKAKLHRYFKGQIKTVTVRRKSSGKYFVSILVDEKIVAVQKAPVVEEQTVGIDLGLTHFLIDSDGNKTDNPRFLKASLKKLAKEQKIFARKKKFSKNRHKQKLKVACIHERVANQRLDFLHKLTAKLVFKNHATSFALEDLNVSGMVRNSRLSRSITDVSWSKFKALLNYKCAWYGKNLLEIGRFEASSKLCSHCEHKLEKLDLLVRYWKCPNCKAEHDRDINAAVNIKRLALVGLLPLEYVLGHSTCVKSSSEAKLLNSSVSAKDGYSRGSQRVLTIVSIDESMSRNVKIPCVYI